MRQEIFDFAEEMEKQLAANDHKGGWDDCDESFLFSELDNHLFQLKRSSLLLSAATAPADGYCPERDEIRLRLLDDAADVANFAMMLADINREL